MKLIAVCSKALVEGLSGIRDMNDPTNRVKVTQCYLSGHFWNKNGVMDGGISFHQDANFRSRDNDREAWFIEYPRALSAAVRNRLAQAQVIIEVEGAGLLQSTADKKLHNLCHHTGIMVDDFNPTDAANDFIPPPKQSLSNRVARLTARLASVLG